ncbi:hypothetical protein [Paenibacillus sp. NPDC101420]|uniref:hypothetical protein n=2 Tax=Paenibacillus TaxID=44249 RepID=UPI003D00C386
MAQLNNDELLKWKKEIEAELADSTEIDALQEEINKLFTRLQVVSRVEMRLIGTPEHSDFMESFVQPIQRAFNEKNAELSRIQKEQWQRQIMLENINEEISIMLQR